MNSTCFILFAFIACCTAYLTIDRSFEIDEWRDVVILQHISDEEALKRIEAPLKNMKKIQELSQGFLTESQLEMIIVRSIDTKCMLNMYRNHSLIDEIYNVEKENYLQASIYAGIAVMCSSKTDILLNYFLDNLLAQRFLLEALINEPEMEKYREWLHCANVYAILTEIVDSTEFALKLNMNDEQRSKCIDWVDREVTEQFKSLNNPDKPATCDDNLMYSARQFAFKYGLLVQVEVTDVQKKNLRKSFSTDFHKFMDEVLECGTESIKTQEKFSQNYYELTKDDVDDDVLVDDSDSDRYDVV